jgi:hypothetical protein
MDQGTLDLIAKYRQYNPEAVNFTDEQIASMGLPGFDSVPKRADFSGYEMSTFPASDIFNKLDAEAMSLNTGEVPIRQGILDPSIFNYQQNLQTGLTDPTPYVQIDNRFIDMDTSPDLTYDVYKEDDKGFGDPIEEEEDKFSLMDYIPFIGDKSLFQGLVSLMPERSQVARGLDEMYRNRNSAGTISSGLMAGYNPISGGFLNTMTGGRLGSPTSYGLQRAYEKRMNTIKNTLGKKYNMGEADIADILAGSYKGDVDSSLIQRLQDLDDAKRAELSMLQEAQKRDDDRREADAYATQTGAGSGYKGGENTRAARTTGNYDDPFDPGYAD